MAANFIRRQLFARPERVIRDRINPLEFLNPEEIRSRYRFFPETILYLVRILHITLSRPTRRSSPLSMLLQLFVALRFFASGSYQLVISNTLHISQPTVSQIVRRVANALKQISNRVIKLPNEREESDVSRRFFNIAGFPNVIGCIDSCLKKIKKPTFNTNEYICRKGYPALNTQFTCLPDHRFSSIIVKWPGSCHDSRVFNESAVKTYMENGDHGVLLGDSGYANRRYMLTPFLNPLNEPQQRYNSSHCRTRVRIEQNFGILKNRFGALLIPLRLTPEWAIVVIIACAVLHNIAITKKDTYEPLMEEDLDNQTELPQENDAPTGLATRQYFVNQHFH